MFPFLKLVFLFGFFLASMTSFHFQFEQKWISLSGVCGLPNTPNRLNYSIRTRYERWWPFKSGLVKVKIRLKVDGHVGRKRITRITENKQPVSVVWNIRFLPLRVIYERPLWTWRVWHTRKSIKRSTNTINNHCSPAKIQANAILEWSTGICIDFEIFRWHKVQF